MALRIRQVERACACRNGAHKALPQTKLGKVDSLGIKTFGGVKFKNAVCAQYIEGADFRDHVLRNFADDPVKARLCSSGSAINSRNRLSSTRGPVVSSRISSEAPLFAQPLRQAYSCHPSAKRYAIPFVSIFDTRVQNK